MRRVRAPSSLVRYDSPRLATRSEWNANATWKHSAAGTAASRNSSDARAQKKSAGQRETETVEPRSARMITDIAITAHTINDAVTGTSVTGGTIAGAAMQASPAAAPTAAVRRYPRARAAFGHEILLSASGAYAASSAQQTPTPSA